MAVGDAAAERLERCLRDARRSEVARRVLPDGRLGIAYEIWHGRARLGVRKDEPRSPYDDAWDYPTPLDAAQALAAWDPASGPEPPGWEFHPGSGRARPCP